MRTMEMSKALAIVLRKHREAKGLTQEALAEKAHLHPVSVGFIEQFKRNVSIDTASTLAQVFDVPLSQLIKEAEAVQRTKH